MPGGGDDMLGEKIPYEIFSRKFSEGKNFWLKTVFMLKTVISIVIAGWDLIRNSVSLIGMG